LPGFDFNIVEEQLQSVEDVIETVADECGSSENTLA